MLPLLKWTGGKRKLVPKIKELMPSSYNRYFEPFVGGGALFFNLEPDGAVIADTNWQLINFYSQVAANPLYVLEESDQHLNEKEYYNEIRNWDRLPEEEQNKITNLQWAGRFLYLNKTAYSGMWRVNQKNQMNVPFANYKSARLNNKVEKYADKEHLLDASNLLRSTDILNVSYHLIPKNVKNLGEQDFFYLDPPYDNTWTNYTPIGFNKYSQELLADFCHDLDQMGVKFLLSNNSTPDIMDFYEGFHIIEVQSGQSILGRHGKGEKREKVTEVLIRNYE